MIRGFSINRDRQSAGDWSAGQLKRIYWQIEPEMASVSGRPSADGRGVRGSAAGLRLRSRSDGCFPESSSGGSWPCIHRLNPRPQAAVGSLNLPSCIAHVRSDDAQMNRFRATLLLASAENATQCFGKRLAFHVGTDRDAQELVDARQFEVADDDVFFA